MSYFSLLILAFALSIDAVIVSFLYGLKYDCKNWKNSLIISSVTGFFQGFFPVLGYYLTGIVRTYLVPYAKFIVFLIFILLGIKFIKEAFECKSKINLCFTFLSLLMVGIATSIDAFSVGATLSLYNNKILFPALVIAVITFINSGIGYKIGGKLKHFPSRNLEIIGGCLLIILGIKALF
ncbi:manganese efflux pump [bacterium]|nr:manganese efflux pump [bacterium]